MVLGMRNRIRDSSAALTKGKHSGNTCKFGCGDRVGPFAWELGVSALHRGSSIEKARRDPGGLDFVRNLDGPLAVSDQNE